MEEKEPVFLTLDNFTPVNYPVGIYQKNTQDYTTEIANKIMSVYGTIKEQVYIKLIARGTSGTILCGSVWHILTMMKYKAIICVSRKEEENCHGVNMDGLNFTDFEARKSVYIVIDDFISSGTTIATIVKDVYNHSIREIGRLDMLFVGNQGSDLKIVYKEQPRYAELRKFKVIYSNPA